jgi:hypothetical protein
MNLALEQEIHQKRMELEQMEHKIIQEQREERDLAEKEQTFRELERQENNNPNYAYDHKPPKSFDMKLKESKPPIAKREVEESKHDY